jgi:hypothetical protein
MVGKEGYPTWRYDCVVSQGRQFFEVHGPFHENTNEKTMVRNSELVRRLGKYPLLNVHEYNLLTGLPPPQDVMVTKGVHGIHDRDITDGLQLLPDRSRMRRLLWFLSNMGGYPS